MALSINSMDGCGLSNKVHYEYLPKKTKASNSFHSILSQSCGSNKVECFSVKVSEHMISKAFKDKTIHQLHCKNFGLKQLYSTFK